MSGSDGDSGAGYVIRSHYEPKPPEVLVVVFGSLAFGLDDAGLHIRVIDPRTTRSSNR